MALFNQRTLLDQIHRQRLRETDGPSSSQATEWGRMVVARLVGLHFPFVLWLSTIVDTMEHWLQMMLTWDPQQRGGGIDPNTNGYRCFQVMEQLLSLKVSGKIIHFG